MGRDQDYTDIPDIRRLKAWIPGGGVPYIYIYTYSMLPAATHPQLCGGRQGSAMDGGSGSGIGIRATVLTPKTRRQAKQAGDLVSYAFVCLLYVLVWAFELDDRGH